MRLRIPHMVSSDIMAIGYGVMAISGMTLHLLFPARPIGEALLESFVVGGVAMFRIPQKAPPTAAEVEWAGK